MKSHGEGPCHRIRLSCNLSQIGREPLIGERGKLCKELYVSEGVRLRKRDIWQRKEGKELRKRIKEIVPCTNKDIAGAIEYALEHKLAEMVMDPSKKQREEFHVLDTEKVTP